MDKEERHQYLLHRLSNLEVQEIKEGLEVQEIKEDPEVQEIKEELEVQETQVETRGDQGRRGAQTPRQSSTRRAGHHLSPHRGKQIGEVSGTS